MSARLVSRKPRPYASLGAVSISRVRLSGCAVCIFADSEELVIYLTQIITPMRPCCQPPNCFQMPANRELFDSSVGLVTTNALVVSCAIDDEKPTSRY